MRIPDLQARGGVGIAANEMASDQPTACEFEDAIQPKRAPELTRVRSESNRVAAAMMIVGAWLAGALMLQLSSLDEFDPTSRSDHWGRHATLLQPVGDPMTRVADPLGVPAALTAPPVRATAAGESRTPGVQAGFVGSGPGANADRTEVQLSSHQGEIDRYRTGGLQLPMLYLQPDR